MDIENICNDLYDELYKQEEIIDKIYSDIDILWENVMKPYLENIYSKEVLNKLSDDDYEKFFKFICSNCTVLNDTYKKITDINCELEELSVPDTGGEESTT